MPQSNPTLIADIGGTNARFALVWPGSAELDVVGSVATHDCASVVEAIGNIVHRGRGVHPRSAVLAVAAPIDGERMKLTNGPWTFEPRSMLGELDLDEIVLLNDFEAQALALPRLRPEDLLPIGTGRMKAGATKLVVGPGTGLGAAALIDAGGWRPIGGEGGHLERAPITPRERAIWPHLAGENQRIDAEQILSGPGLVTLYRAVAATDGIAPQFSSPNQILQAGLSGDSTAAETLDLFAVHLGRYAGDLALVFMAHGGVYISGGIGLRLSAFLKASGFRTAFDEKPPYRDILRAMAVSVVIHPYAGLVGLAGLVRLPGEYAVPLAGRRWLA